MQKLTQKKADFEIPVWSRLVSCLLQNFIMWIDHQFLIIDPVSTPKLIVFPKDYHDNQTGNLWALYVIHFLRRTPVRPLCAMAQAEALQDERLRAAIRPGEIASKLEDGHQATGISNRCLLVFFFL